MWDVRLNTVLNWLLIFVQDSIHEFVHPFNILSHDNFSWVIKNCSLYISPAFENNHKADYNFPQCLLFNLVNKKYKLNINYHNLNTFKGEKGT